MPFHRLATEAIEQSLDKTTRRYLLGKLERSQELAFIEDCNLEIGISSYPQATWEAAHRHARATQYQYVLKGMTEYLDIDTGAVHRFRTGDFYTITQGTSYLQRIKQDTRILFIKYPSGNDKELVSVTPEQQAWAEEKLRVERLDLSAQIGDAPPANALKPAAAVAVFNKERLLLVKRRDSGFWSMPGGVMEWDESLPDCARREVKEETGLDIEITGLIGTYTDPMVRIAYSDGEVRREFSVLFAATTSEETLSTDDESTAIVWADLKTLDPIQWPIQWQNPNAAASRMLCGIGGSEHRSKGKVYFDGAQFDVFQSPLSSIVTPALGCTGLFDVPF